MHKYTTQQESAKYCGFLRALCFYPLHVQRDSLHSCDMYVSVGRITALLPATVRYSSFSTRLVCIQHFHSKRKAYCTVYMCVCVCVCVCVCACVCVCVCVCCVSIIEKSCVRVSKNLKS